MNRKNAVQPASPALENIPPTTMNPAKIAIMLMTTCSTVKLATDIPNITSVPLRPFNLAVRYFSVHERASMAGAVCDCGGGNALRACKLPLGSQIHANGIPIKTPEPHRPGGTSLHQCARACFGNDACAERMGTKMQRVLAP